MILFNKNLPEVLEVKDTGDDNDPFKIMKNSLLPQAEWEEAKFLAVFSGNKKLPQNISNYLLSLCRQFVKCSKYFD